MLGFLVSLKLTVGDYCFDQDNNSSLNQCFSKWAISPPCGRKRNIRGRKANRGQKGAMAHSRDINPFSKH